MADGINKLPAALNGIDRSVSDVARSVRDNTVGMADLVYQSNQGVVGMMQQLASYTEAVATPASLNSFRYAPSIRPSPPKLSGMALTR